MKHKKKNEEPTQYALAKVPDEDCKESVQLAHTLHIHGNRIL
jgi:hypothetical protein